MTSLTETHAAALAAAAAEIGETSVQIQIGATLVTIHARDRARESQLPEATRAEILRQTSSTRRALWRHITRQPWNN